jgi:hypothetical protein
MICPTCNNPIPDTYFACPLCLAERSRPAVRLYQHRPLREVAEGRVSLTTRQIGPTRHIQMWATDLTFCDVSVESNHRRSSTRFCDVEAALKEPVESNLCNRCCREVAEIMQEALCSA